MSTNELYLEDQLQDQSLYSSIFPPKDNEPSNITDEPTQLYFSPIFSRKNEEQFYEKNKIDIDKIKKSSSKNKNKINKKAKEKNLGKKKNRHNKNGSDNIMTKTKRKLITSAISYVNEKIKYVYRNKKYKPEFKKIKYDHKKANLGKIKKINLGDLIIQDVSKKYKNFEVDFNKKQYEKIKENEIVKSILNEKLIDFFREVYYKNKRTISLSEDNINSTINLSNKVKLYENFFREKDDKEFKDRVKHVIEKKFFD